MKRDYEAFDLDLPILGDSVTDYNERPGCIHCGRTDVGYHYDRETGHVVCSRCELKQIDAIRGAWGDDA